MKRVLILITLLILTACAAVDSPTPSPSPTATATLTPSATATPSATSTPTVTLTPSNTPPPTDTPTITATPEFHNPNPGGDIFFTPYDDEDCQLPCWQGLRIGESTIDDVQVMFDRVFGLTVSEESYKNSPDNPVGEYEVEGTKIAKHFWELPGYAFFRIDVLLDRETNILQGLHFTQFWGDGTLLYPYSPKQIIEIEGIPETFYIRHSVEDQSVIALAYEDGYVFHYFLGATVFEETYEDKIVHKSSFCLNGPVLVADYFIVSPFENLKGDGLDSVHQSWFSWLSNKEPSEDVIGLSAEEIGEIALQSDNLCFMIEE